MKQGAATKTAEALKETIEGMKTFAGQEAKAARLPECPAGKPQYHGRPF